MEYFNACDRALFCTKPMNDADFLEVQMCSWATAWRKRSSPSEFYLSWGHSPPVPFGWTIFFFLFFIRANSLDLDGPVIVYQLLKLLMTFFCSLPITIISPWSSLSIFFFLGYSVEVLLCFLIGHPAQKCLDLVIGSQCLFQCFHFFISSGYTENLFLLYFITNGSILVMTLVD